MDTLGIHNMDKFWESRAKNLDVISHTRFIDSLETISYTSFYEMISL